MTLQFEKQTELLPGTTQTHPVVLRLGEVSAFFFSGVTVKVDR